MANKVKDDISVTVAGLLAAISVGFIGLAVLGIFVAVYRAVT